MRPRLQYLFVAGLLLIPPLLPEFYVTLFNYIGLYALVAIGLVLLTGVGGLTSFGQAAFVGLGAYTTAFLTTTQSLPTDWAWLGSPWAGLIVGMALTLGFAWIIGQLTLRLSGHYLPLGTIAWGMSLYFLFGNLGFLGGHTGISGIPALDIFGFSLKESKHFFYLIWLLVLLAIWMTSNLLESRIGRAIRSLKSGTVMAEAMGVDTAKTKLIIFLLAAGLAALSGWLYAHLQRFINPTPFSLHVGIEYLFMAVIGGAGYVWGAVLGAGLITVLKQWLQDLLPSIFGGSGNYEVIVFGLLMILVLHRAPSGIWPLLLRLFPKGSVGQAGNRKSDRVGTVLELPAHSNRPVGAALEVKDLVKRFGGLVANNRITLSVRSGEILALIGPNGAGKSTLFNSITGVDQPSSGEVWLFGQRVDGWRAHDIARLGLSRTFQHVRLLGEMSVISNVAIGAHQRGQRGLVAGSLRLDREEESAIFAEAGRQLDRVGLSGQAEFSAGQLALGQQRLVEVARALCAAPGILLLDEPAAGLRYLEKGSLGDLLRDLRDQGMAILLVEHDMDFVMGLADRIVVMEFGELIAEGTPKEIQSNPDVIEAYLGGVD